MARAFGTDFEGEHCGDGEHARRAPRQRAAAIVTSAARCTRPEELIPWIDRYRTVASRGEFLWSWVLRGLELTTLSCVAPGARTSVVVAKTLSVMVDVLLDDLADEGDDSAALERALALCSVREPRRAPRDTTPPDGPYLGYVAEVWTETMSRLRAMPRFDAFADILEFDYAQLFNTMRYAALLRRSPEARCLLENELHQPANMHIVLNATIDLMASPRFDVAELGLAREVFVRVERMGRIGNEISTWERELATGDYSSGIFSYALREGIITPAQLRLGDGDSLRRTLVAHNVEDYFLRRWRTLRAEVAAFATRLTTIDVRTLVGGFDELLELDLASRGRK